MENQLYELQYAIDTFYFLVMGALVMWMAAGFAMLESGLVRAKNTTEILTKNIALYAIAASLVYWAGLIRFMDREELGTFFQFGDNIALFRENISDFGMAILYMLLGGLIAGVVSGTGIGALVTTPFIN